MGLLKSPNAHPLEDRQVVGAAYHTKQQKIACWLHPPQGLYERGAANVAHSITGGNGGNSSGAARLTVVFLSLLLV